MGDFVYYILLGALYFLVFMLGASVFSFLNVAVYRFPLKMSFVKGRSFCPSCKKTLSASELVPIFSYIFLGGKCKGCGAKIPIYDLLSEIFGGLLSVFCFIFYDVFLLMTFQSFLRALLCFALFALLFAISVIDIKTLKIPDGFVLSVAVAAFFSIFAFPVISLLDRVIGAFAVSFPMLLLAYLIQNAFGGGDIKLMAAAGLFLGWKLCLLSFFVGGVASGIYAMAMIALKKKKKTDIFALAPFLSFGIAVALLFGENILSFYAEFLVI